MPPIPAQALLNACQAGDAAEVSKLLPAGGTRLNLSGQAFQDHQVDKSTPLILAAWHGHTDRRSCACFSSARPRAPWTT